MEERQPKQKIEPKEILWVDYICLNTNCTSTASPRVDQRNFERVPFYGAQIIPATITCTSCGSAMIKQ